MRICGTAVFIAALFCVSGEVSATTWHVEADGSGDFSVIQDAIDAAADGDLIAIGPGRYDQYDGSAGFDVYINIVGKRLTLAGAGEAETIIGPADPDHHPWPGRDVYLVYAHDTAALTIRDLTLEHSPDSHLLCHADRLEVDNCTFRGGRYGIRAECPNGGYVRASTFSDLTPYGCGVDIQMHTQDFVVVDCRFENSSDGVYVTGPGTRVEIRDCFFDGGCNGCGFVQGATGRITGNRFRETSNFAVIVGSGPITVASNVIDQDSGWGMYLVTDQSAIIRDNVIATRTGGCLFVIYAGEPIEFHRNHLLRCGLDGGPDLGGYFARTIDEWYQAPVYADFSGNYWGTTDLDEIANYIVDGHDLEGVELYLDYEPIAGGPVPIRGRSWSQVKALFEE